MIRKIVTALIVVPPLLFLVQSSFTIEAGEHASLGLDHYRYVFNLSGWRLWRVSLIYAVGSSCFAIVVGVTMIYAVPGQSLPFNANTLEGFPLSMLPFCWVALIPMTSEERAPSFARLLLPLLAVLQSLHG